MAPLRYYLPGLPDYVTEEEIVTAFAKYGDLTEVLVAKDKASKGLGYVTMAEGVSPDSILGDVHYLGGVPIRALLTRESLAGTDSMKAHISNCEHLSAEEIRTAFSQFGPILDVHTPKDHNTGERKRYAFITFGSIDTFNVAIEMGSVSINGQTIDIKPAANSGASTKVGKGGQGDVWGGNLGDWSAGCGGGKGVHPAVNPALPLVAPRARSSPKVEGMKYFVCNIPKGCSDDDLRGYFSKYGKVLGVSISIDKHDSGGDFAYVTLEDDSSRDTILGDVHTAGDSQMCVMLSKEHLCGTESMKVHVDNVKDVRVEVLRDTFAQFGPVLDVHMPRDPATGERKKFAFITFGSEEALSTALSMGGIEVGGQVVPIKPAAHSNKETAAGTKDVKGKGKAWSGGSQSFGGKAGSDMWGGKGSDMWGGKGSDMWGGKGSDMWGGKGSDMWGSKGAGTWGGKGGAFVGKGDTWGGGGGGNSGWGGSSWGGSAGGGMKGKGGSSIVGGGACRSAPYGKAGGAAAGWGGGKVGMSSGGGMWGAGKAGFGY